MQHAKTKQTKVCAGIAQPSGEKNAPDKASGEISGEHTKLLSLCRSKISFSESYLAIIIYCKLGRLNSKIIVTNFLILKVGCVCVWREVGGVNINDLVTVVTKKISLEAQAGDVSKIKGGGNVFDL